MNQYPIYRLPGDNESPSQYPSNSMRLIWPMLSNTRYLVGFHFKNRKRPNGYQSTRNWITEYRRQLRSCGYNEVAKQLNEIKAKL